MTMEVINSARKVKILIEYPKGDPHLGFVTINEDDLKKIVVNVFLKSGIRIWHDNIKSISMKIREER